MKRYFIYILFFMIISFPQIVITDFAVADEGAEALKSPYQDIVGIINHARSNPWEEAARFGLDPMVLRKDIIPEDVASLWDAGIWPLFQNAALEKASIAMCEDMLSRGYFSTISPEGVTPMDRALAEGYPAGPVWADFGVIAFDFYLDPLGGASSILDLMMQQTILGATDLHPSLLYPWLPDAGVAICGGYLEIEGYVSFIYVFSVILSRPSPDSGYKVQCGYFYDDMNGNLRYDPGEGVSGLELFDPVDERISAVTGPRGEYCLGNILGGEVIRFCDTYFFITRPEMEAKPITDDGTMYRWDYEIGGLLQEGVCP